MIYTKKEGTLIASGHTRIVNGYYEITNKQIIDDNIHIPWQAEWRTIGSRAYYVEYRTNDIDYIKIYYQMNLVKYADYKLHHYYVDVNDVIIK